MTPTQEGTTLILASIAVCLMIFAMNQQYRRSPTLRLGSSMNLGGFFSDLRQRVVDFNNRRKAKNTKSARALLGKKRARVDPNLDCTNVQPSDTNWARCAQGVSSGRIISRKPTDRVTSTILDFEKDNDTFQGLGTRLQDSFAKSTFESDAITNLGAGLGGIKIDPTNLRNNGFFSQGTENASAGRTSGLDGAAAFPFLRKSDNGAEANQRSTAPTGPVSQSAAVGMGMSFEEFTRGVDTSDYEPIDKPRGKREIFDQRPDFESKPSNGTLGVNPFITPQTPVAAANVGVNPFVTPQKPVAAGLKLDEAFRQREVGAGLKLEEAFKQREVGAGLKLSEAFANKEVGAAVSPVSSAEVGVSSEEIASATASLRNVNIVQSTTGGQLNFGIRP